MICEDYSCDCGHLAPRINTCSVCNQTICNDCCNTDLHERNTICNLCIEHRVSVNKLFDFIEININILYNIDYNSKKYIMYKNVLETLRTIYNNIITFNSIIYENDVYNYLSEPEIIYNLIKKSTTKLYYIYNNHDAFLCAE